MTSPSSNLRTIAALMQLEIADMFNAWEAERPLRTGAPHASSILVPDENWCARKLVLAALFPESARRPEHKPWDTSRNMRNKHGWMIHEKYQGLILKYGPVVYFNGKPELDLTHFDETRYVYFSPDAITTFGGYYYVWEIKGYKQESVEKLDEASDPPNDAHKQVNLYLQLLQDLYGPKLRGLILVENKNTQQPLTWVVEHNATLARVYTDRCYEIKGAVSTRRIPERVCLSMNDKNAQSCPMRDRCFNGK